VSGNLPPLRARDVVRKLRRAGFLFDRQARGSHEIWRHPETLRRVVIPNHPGTIPTGTLRAIVRQTGLSVEDFNDL